MSNTTRGSKGAGYEYWSRRPFSQSTPGRFSKHRTHKAERQQGKKQAEQEQIGTNTGEFYCILEERYIGIYEEHDECRSCNGWYDYGDDLSCGNSYCDMCGAVLWAEDNID